MPFARYLGSVVSVVLLCAGCSRSSPSRDTPAGNAALTPGAGSAKPRQTDAIVVTIVYGSEKKTWLETEATAFQGSPAALVDGRAVKLDLRAMGSGEALKAIGGGTKATVFSPASSLYLPLLNDAWLTAGGHTKPIVGKSEALVLSPVVIAMWKPMAEALGWPKKQLSWRDLLKLDAPVDVPTVARSPAPGAPVKAAKTGWASVGFPEWGRFKLGHCHPEFSNSGYLAILAEAYAGAKKTRDLTLTDLDAPATRKFLTDIEQTIVHYGKSTGFFADKMVERGPSYVSAAVLYENLVIESYAKSAEQPIVAIYPLEGTFWSDHPYAILDAEWVGDAERKGAEAFLAFLRAKPAQERALSLGFRPADPAIPMGSPIDAAHGVDPKEPQTVLPLPDVKTLQKLLAVWELTKKSADVAFVFDKSGSMSGKPLEEAKRGAKSFLSALSDRDEVSLLFFDSQLYPPVGPLPLSTGRQQLLARIGGVTAGGGTALYDAVASAYDVAQKRALDKPAQIHAVVVMTDGADESSVLALPALKARFPKEEASVKVFTIAYGNDAQGAVLADIAEAAKGSFSKGTVETIRDVYLDMASFF